MFLSRAVQERLEKYLSIFFFFSFTTSSRKHALRYAHKHRLKNTRSEIHPPILTRTLRRSPAWLRRRKVGFTQYIFTNPFLYAELFIVKRKEIRPLFVMRRCGCGGFRDSAWLLPPTGICRLKVNASVASYG